MGLEKQLQINKSKIVKKLLKNVDNSKQSNFIKFFA